MSHDHTTPQQRDVSDDGQSRRAFLKAAGGVAVGGATATGVLGSDLTGPATAAPEFGLTPSPTALVVNDFEGDAWPGENQLGNYADAGGFLNGGGTVSTATATRADAMVQVSALHLEYDGAGWLMSNVRQSVGDYSHLVLWLAGDAGGEGEHVQLEVGGVEGTLAEMASSPVGTDLAPVAVDLEAAGVDTSAVDAVDLGFFGGASGAVDLAAIAFEQASSGPTQIVDGATPTDPDDDGHYEDLTGNGEIDNQDVVAYFQNMGTEANPGPMAQNGNLQYFDYTGNDSIDYQDLIQLFGEI